MPKAAQSAENSEIPKKLSCGLIMPISAIDGCGPEHWQDVKNIIVDAIGDIDGYEFNVSLVSDRDDVGVIQGRIVQNIYDSDIVVCDVSCKNPNVMFELGMRLAFGKPIVVIKDDLTGYLFDTSPLEHLNYPRDLRFSKMVDFKKNLGDKVRATYEESTKEGWRSFISHFSSIKPASLEQVEISSGQAFIVDAINELSSQVSMLFHRQGAFTPPAMPISSYQSTPRIAMTKGTIMQLESAIKRFSHEYPEVSSDSRKGNSDFYKFVAASFPHTSSYDEFVSLVDRFMESHKL